MTGRSIRLQQITTEAGTCLLTSRSRALVRIGERYAARAAMNLVSGDRVCFRKDHIRRTLDEVDLVLSGTSQRYVDARAQLMENNSQGRWIPKLRTYLLRGINVQHSIEPVAVAERKILFQGDDFLPEQYRFIVNLVQNEIIRYVNGNGVRPVCWDTLSNWVSGSVIAPEEKRFFNALGTFNPDFFQIANDFTTNGPWAQAYNLYVTIRKISMSYLAAQYEPPHSLGLGNSDRSPLNNRSLADELSSIVSTFASDIRSQFLDIEVFSNQELRMRRDSFRRRQTFEPHLFKGIVTIGNNSTTEAPNGRSIEHIENYSIFELFGMASPWKNPEQALENAKIFALRKGFAVEDLRHVIDRPAEPRDVERMMDIFDVPKIDEIRSAILKDTGERYEDLTLDEKAMVDSEVHNILMDMKNRWKQESEQLARFKERLRKIV